MPESYTPPHPKKKPLFHPEFPKSCTLPQHRFTQTPDVPQERPSKRLCKSTLLLVSHVLIVNLWKFTFLSFCLHLQVKQYTEEEQMKTRKSWVNNYSCGNKGFLKTVFPLYSAKYHSHSQWSSAVKKCVVTRVFKDDPHQRSTEKYILLNDWEFRALRIRSCKMFPRSAPKETKKRHRKDEEIHSVLRLDGH